jgi:hypothetical protein
MKILPIDITGFVGMSTYTLDKTFEPDEKKIYLVYIDNQLGIIKRVHNDQGKPQFKVFTLDGSFTDVYGIVFNNSNNLKEFIGAVANKNCMVYEFDDMRDILENAEVLLTLLPR